MTVETSPIRGQEQRPVPHHGVVKPAATVPSLANFLTLNCSIFPLITTLLDTLFPLPGMTPPFFSSIGLYEK